MAAEAQILARRPNGEKPTIPRPIIQAKGNSRRRDCFVAALLVMTGISGAAPRAGNGGAIMQNKANFRRAECMLIPV